MIAGEASGDLHGGNLARALGTQAPGLALRGWGGDHMAAAGVHIVKHIRELAFMGFAEVLLNLRAISNNFKACKADILAFRPDALVLIDYPGFNLRMAKWAKAQGIQVLYYISPQLWAWKEKRVEQVRAYVDRMYCILPFEQAWYAARGVEVDFVGHPLLDALAQRSTNALDLRAAGVPGGKPVVALLPGSRKQEISLMLPVMAQGAVQESALQAVVAGAPSQAASYYASVLPFALPVLHNHTYDLVQAARCALVASGTATLETALLGTPQVACYKGSALTYRMAKTFIKVKYICLVNLILDEPLVEEIIQDALTPARLAAATHTLATDEAARARLHDGYARLREKLGGPGASTRTATLMLERINAKS